MPSNIDIKYIITACFGDSRNFLEIFIQLKIAQIIEECSKSFKKLYHLFKKKSGNANVLLQITFG